VVSQSWITGSDDPPAPASIPRGRDGKNREDGPYVDKWGIVRVPSHLVGRVGATREAGKNVGVQVGRSKNACLESAVGEELKGARLEFNPGAGYVDHCYGSKILKKLYLDSTQLSLVLPGCLQCSPKQERNSA